MGERESRAVKKVTIPAIVEQLMAVGERPRLIFPLRTVVCVSPEDFANTIWTQPVLGWTK